MKRPQKPPQEREGSEPRGGPSSRRRTYARPVLQRYGTVGKLTQTGSRSGTDASGMMGPCL